MNIITKIFNEVLEEILPTKEELIQINNIVEFLKSLLSDRANELGIEYVSIDPQGSTGIKQTQLRDDFDIDLFIGLDFEDYKHNYESLSKTQFKKKIKNEFLRLCNEWIIKALRPKEFQNPKLLYAEHPYVKVKYTKNDLVIDLDIVLYFELDLQFIRENGPITAVDRTPWHGRFIKQELSEDQKNQVRILKQFFKACHSYGDTSAVGKVGFIGYSAELLIYYLKDIKNVLENFKSLDEKILDYFGRKKNMVKKIPHFQKDHLIIIDPIDKNRNVASAISQKAYKFCKYKITQFLNEPSKDFLEIKEIPELRVRENQDLKKKLFILEFESIDEEVHYTEKRDKMYSLGESIKTHGERELTNEERFGKIIFEVYFEPQLKEYNLAIYCSRPKIPPTYSRRGPPIKSEKHVKRFKEKNPDYYTKGKYYWVEEKREFSDFLIFLKEFIQEKIPPSLKVKNLSRSDSTQTTSGKKALYILINWIVPFA